MGLVRILLKMALAYENLLKIQLKINKSEKKGTTTFENEKSN